MPPKKKPKVKKAKPKVPQVQQIVTVNVGSQEKPKRKRKPRAKKAMVSGQPSLSPVGVSQTQTMAPKYIYPTQNQPENPLLTDEFKSFLKAIHGGNPANNLQIGQPPQPPANNLQITPQAPAQPPAQPQQPSALVQAPPKKPVVEPDKPLPNQTAIPLEDIKTQQDLNDVVLSGKTPSSLDDAMSGTTLDLDKPFGRGEAAEETHDEAMVNMLLEVEAQKDAEKAREKAGAEEDQPIPAKTTKTTKSPDKPTRPYHRKTPEEKQKLQDDAEKKKLEKEAKAQRVADEAERKKTEKGKAADVKLAVDLPRMGLAAATAQASEGSGYKDF